MVGTIVAELASVGYELVLYVTPHPELHLPHHHSLAVAIAGQVQDHLEDDAAGALIRALTVVDNPYQTKP